MRVVRAGCRFAFLDENGYHLNTGFLSTPFLCPVLADYGYTETAYHLLLQTENLPLIFRGRPD